MPPLSRRRLIPVFASAAAVVLIACLTLVSSFDADAHPGHPQKKLFNGRWYNAGTMELSTSGLGAGELLLCDNNYQSCLSKWGWPLTGAINDWNYQNDTVYFDVRSNFDINYDVNIFVGDVVLGNPNILGLAVFYSSSGSQCNPDACTYRWGEAYIGDNGHDGPYGTDQVKHATVVHELGHLLSLRHESTLESGSPPFPLYPCGFDNTGPIPVSIMAYKCIDPAAAGGAGLNFVQPWDVCGVNHAYPDPVYGFSGCPATPTPLPTPTPSPTPSPTPTPTPVPTNPGAWGNVDCGGGIGSVDALKVLRFGAALSVSQTEPCMDIGDTHPVELIHAQGDIDCSGAVNSVDSLKLLRFAASLSVSQTLPCPVIGVDP